MSVLALVFSEQLVFDGIVRGMIYGLLGIGIVLVFRASGVINFAQGQFGTIGASVMAVLYVNEGTPFWVTVPLAILIGAVVGGLTELLVVRRLFNQPRLLLFIATVGVAQVILLLQLQLPQIDLPVTYPTPINDRWHIGDLVVRGDQLIVLVAVPLIGVLLAFLLQRTRFGLSVRSATDNPSAASLSGMRVKSVSTQVWVLSGVLGSVSVLLAGPVLNQRASDVGVALGPSLLLFALTSALVGGMTSFSLTMAGGVLLGLLDILVFANSTEQPGTNILVMFIVLVVLVPLRGTVADRRVGVDAHATRASRRSRVAQAPTRTCRPLRGNRSPDPRGTPASSARDAPEPARRLRHGARLPDGRGVGNRAHGLGRPAVTGAVRLRGGGCLPHRVLREGDGLPARDGTRRALGRPHRGRDRDPRAASARSLSRDHHARFRDGRQRLPRPPASIQHVLHRVRREPATSDRWSVGLRDRQARVLLLLLRRGVDRDSGGDASPAHRYRSNVAGGARQRRTTPRRTRCPRPGRR